MRSGSLTRVALSALVAGCVMLLMHSPRNMAVGAADMPKQSGTVRVGMWTLWHDREIKLTPLAKNGEISLVTCDACARLTFSGQVILKASGNLVVVESASKMGPVGRIDIDHGAGLSAHGETVLLRQRVEISARSGVLVVAVTLPIESYVERVVASESGAADTPESLKALAIVVRSFALHEPHGHSDYELCDSTHCQLLHWGSHGDRAHEAHAAALTTSGETLWFSGKRALAYFSKDCGGHTALPSEVWPQARAVTYLPSQADRYCTITTGREWASEITRGDLTVALASHGIARPGWDHLTVLRRGESGRITTLSIDSKEISAEDFRLAVGESIGWNKLPSTWFEVNQQGDRFFFHGRGWGHGIGLCQKGAAAMAEQNRNATEILAHYFPGAHAADELTGRTWQRFKRDGFALESLDAADSAFLPELQRARAEAARRSGLNMPQPITVRAFGSTPSFRDSTGAPGWVAAFTEGNWIGTQPLRVLASRHLLDDTMRHEFLHALVEHQSTAVTPLWLREGLVELWAGSNVSAAKAPAIKINELDAKLARAGTAADSAAAHSTSAIYASRAVTRYGRERVIEWLHSGVPADVVVSLGQR